MASYKSYLFLWLLSLSMTVLNLIHAVVCVSSSFLSIGYEQCDLFFEPPVGRRLCAPSLSPVAHRTAASFGDHPINMGQVSTWFFAF